MTFRGGDELRGRRTSTMILDPAKLRNAGEPAREQMGLLQFCIPPPVVDPIDT